MYTDDNKNEYFIIGETPILEFVDSNNEVVIKDDALEDFKTFYSDNDGFWKITFSTGLINENISKIWT